MATYRIEDSTLTAIGDAIRTKRDSDALIAPEDMASAILGIDTGGGGGIKVDVGSFKLEKSSTSASSGSSCVYVDHKLGEVPDGIIVWSDEFTPSVAKVGSGNDTYGFIWFRDIFKNPMRGSSTTTIPLDCGLNMYFQYNLTADNVTGSFPSSTTYTYNSNYYNVLTATRFPLLKIGNNNYWNSAVTYRYAVFKKFW